MKINKKVFVITMIALAIISGLVIKNQWKHHGYEISALFDFNRAELMIKK